MVFSVERSKDEIRNLVKTWLLLGRMYLPQVQNAKLVCTFLDFLSLAVADVFQKG
jgi:hypothetical protein